MPGVIACALPAWDVFENHDLGMALTSRVNARGEARRRRNATGRKILVAEDRDMMQEDRCAGGLDRGIGEVPGSMFATSASVHVAHPSPPASPVKRRVCAECGKPTRPLLLNMPLARRSVTLVHRSGTIVV